MAERRAGPSAAAGDGPARPIVFLHIPKTAGMSLRSVLERVYAGYPYEFIGNLGDEHKEFAARPLAERARFALISGHLPWGAQVLVPGSRAITFVRDPVERVISAYYFNKRAPNALHHQTINDGGLTLADVVESGLFAGEYNMMTAMLRSPAAKTAEQSIESAKQNLRSCAAFGIVERFDESLEYLARALRWPREAIGDVERVNATANRPVADDLDPGLVERLRRETGIDRMLYDFANELFDQRNGLARGG